MDNVFIDTSVYEEGQFVASGILKTLINEASDKRIRILLPEITEKEVLSHIKKRVSEDKTRLVEKLLQSVLKEIPSVKDKIEELRRMVKDAEPKIEKQFLDNVSKSGTVRIPLQKNLDLQSILDSYFERKAPFSEKKKSEFPDAFVLKSLELWCKEHNTTCTVLSKDSDMKDYKSEFLIYRDDKEYVSELIRRREEQDALNKLLYQAKLSVSADVQIKDRIYKWVYDQLDNDILYGVALQIEEINDYSIDPEIDIDLDDFEVVGQYEEVFVVRAKALVTASISVSHPDYDTGYYDGEDKQWYFFDDDIVSKLECTLEFPVDFEIDLNGEFPELDSINQGKLLSQSELISSIDDGRSWEYE